LVCKLGPFETSHATDCNPLDVRIRVVERFHERRRILGSGVFHFEQGPLEGSLKK
jgi:hypothetical protein